MLLATVHNSTKYEKRWFVFLTFWCRNISKWRTLLGKRLLVDKTKTFSMSLKKMYWSFFPFLHVFPFWLKGKLEGESEGVTCCKNHQLNLILLRLRYMSSVVNLPQQSSVQLFWKPPRCSDSGSSGYLAGKKNSWWIAGGVKVSATRGERRN